MQWLNVCGKSDIKGAELIVSIQVKGTVIIAKRQRRAVSAMRLAIPKRRAATSRRPGRADRGGRQSGEHDIDNRYGQRTQTPKCSQLR
jgi:hypothetical protein